VTPRTPAGFVVLARPGTRIVVRQDFADALLLATARGTVYEWAAAQPGARVMQGRLPVYVVPLPFGGPSVVVRRNHHGGLFASLRRDRFLFARRPYELIVSLVLAQVGVPTPEVIAQATYRVNALERRVDVVTRELPAGLDLGTALLEQSSPELRAERWRAVTALLGILASHGVWHQDLNVKNIYLAESPDAPPSAALLDVDRVRLHEPGALVARANAARLVRSLRKWRATRGANISDAELALVTSAAAGA
jgi:hypothetical protein